ncbi:OmpP1/FadL family transporter [Thiosulfativibrio zosterae]|uniref:Aromatic hydrocarbon degradation protein n=1 Tax=Thiosulfativibrio zosterae TaxID=2675053 RepID=A0A6F8PK36_9GAMM|nr:outer membrane protein transport protein [Thiosulfativibrio zosterae]BBP42459.1 hypothetical protein THMIRHAT_02050 [Thiosulfativibrio zosterae]
MKYKSTAILFSSILLLISTKVYADQYHYSDILIGDRAAGFSGAYTAISDDPSGLYYNPAGIVRAPDGQLSASANAYNQTAYKYSNINAGGHTWERKSNANIANFFGAFQPFGEFMVGFSIAVPDSNKASQDESFHNYEAADPNWTIQDEIINYKEDDTTLLFGPSLAYKLNDKLSLGATLYIHVRNDEFTFRQETRASNNASGDIVYDILFQKYKTNEMGLKPMLGVMWDASKTFSVGATLAQTFMLSQDPMAQNSQITNASIDKTSGVTVITKVGNNVDAGNYFPVGMSKAPDRQLPLEAKLGFAWFPDSRLIVSTDIQYYGETSDYASVLNIAGGMEYFFSPKISTRFGLNTNNSNNKSLNQPGFDVDMLGLTWSLSQHNRLSALTFGLNYSQGTGKARLLEGSNRIQDLTVQSLTAYIATSMNF